MSPAMATLPEVGLTGWMRYCWRFRYTQTGAAASPATAFDPTAMLLSPMASENASSASELSPKASPPRAVDRSPKARPL